MLKSGGNTQLQKQNKNPVKGKRERKKMPRVEKFVVSV